MLTLSNLIKKTSYLSKEMQPTASIQSYQAQLRLKCQIKIRLLWKQVKVLDKIHLKKIDSGLEQLYACRNLNFLL